MRDETCAGATSTRLLADGRSVPREAAGASTRPHAALGLLLWNVHKHGSYELNRELVGLLPTSLFTSTWWRRTRLTHTMFEAKQPRPRPESVAKTPSACLAQTTGQSLQKKTFLPPGASRRSRAHDAHRDQRPSAAVTQDQRSGVAAWQVPETLVSGHLSVRLGYVCSECECPVPLHRLLSHAAFYIRSTQMRGFVPSNKFRAVMTPLDMSCPMTSMEATTRCWSQWA